MTAFHSGVDDADEKSFDGVHITVGRLDSVPEYSCSIVVQGTREMIDPSILIDGMAPADSVPAAWLEAVKLQPPRLPLGPTEVAFTARAEALYKRYYAGAISEVEYLVGLSEIEKAAEQAAAAERSRLVSAVPASVESERNWLGLNKRQPTASRKGRRRKGGKK